ncbi:hypothetical protein [Psychroserpens luteolus]|uniref:hypothetical protein n=1 Tax=Psychroserpens luteolus TaxID=2855840 RepID=UPI001E462012|nr:hypothetical protein [Psychroserpens luteolus]MCD2259819.1 hypothetical protein [Psychroserpens luteolus]
MSKNSSESQTEIDNYNRINKKQDIPEIYHKVNEEIFKNGKPNADLDVAIQISVWLLENIKGGRGLSLSSDEVLKSMLAGDGGVCSDMAQVFNNFCVINDIKVKEWGVTTIPFNRKYGGHSVNEIFSKDYNKWVLIDVSKGITIHEEGNDIPLSVVELYQINKTEKRIIYNSFIDTVKVNMSKVDNYYLNRSSVPFLVTNYSNKTYDLFLNRLRPFTPVFLIHFLLFVLNKSYKYKFPLNNYKEMFTS